MKTVERKHSKKRDAILGLIRSTTSHPSAQWVYDRLRPRMPGLSLGTVYRNISLFLHEGDIVSVGVVNGEERFDGCVQPHPHFVCGRCGRVADIPCPDTKILRRLSAGAGKPENGGDDFRIDYRKTIFCGVCAACEAVN